MRHELRSASVLLACAVLTSACSNKQEQPKVISATPCPNDAAPRNVTIRITGIPDENPSELQRKYEPLVSYLSAKLGTNVEYVQLPLVEYGAAVQALAANTVDFAWLGGFTFVQARVMAGSVPLVQRDIDKAFTSVFIANAASKIRTMEDIKGKTFAFGSKSSTSGHLMPRHFLTTKFKIDPDQDLSGLPVHTDAHDATVRAVESGKIAAGVLNSEVWERLVRENKVDTTKVKVIWTTPAYVDYLWVANKNVSNELRERFVQAFLELSPENAEHLKLKVLGLWGAKKFGFFPARNEDYEVVEQVGRAIGLIK
jgi:phosphonate transport system substrate-binding protein